MVVVLLVLSGTTTSIQANEKSGTRKWGKARRWAWECRFPKPISTEPTLPRISKTMEKFYMIIRHYIHRNRHKYIL